MGYIIIKKTNRRFTPKKWENRVKKELNGAFITGGQHWPDIVTMTGAFYECKVIKSAKPPDDDQIWTWFFRYQRAQSAQYSMCRELRAIYVLHWQTAKGQWEINFDPWWRDNEQYSKTIGK